MATQLLYIEAVKKRNVVPENKNPALFLDRFQSAEFIEITEQPENKTAFKTAGRKLW